MTTSYSNVPDALNGLSTYMILKGSTLPEVTQAELANFRPSPVDKIVNAAEALYAALPTLDADGKDLTTSLINLCISNQWHTLGQTTRGTAILAALAGTTPTGTTVPEPLAQFMPVTTSTVTLTSTTASLSTSTSTSA